MNRSPLPHPACRTAIQPLPSRTIVAPPADRRQGAEGSTSNLQAAILDALPAEVALLDREGNIVAANAAWRHFARQNACGSANYELGANYLAVCDSARGPDSAEAREVAAGLRRVLAGELAEYSLEYPCHSPTEQRWFRLQAAPLHDGVDGAVVMHIDITAREVAERKRQESLALLSAVVEGTSDAIYVKDREGRYLLINTAGARVLGRSSDEIIGQDDRSLFAAAEAEAIREFDRLIIETGETRTYEGMGRCGGLTRTFFSTKSPLRGPDGSITGVVGVARDMTDRKQAEREIRFNEQRYRSLVEAITAIVWHTPSSGEFDVEQPSWTAFTGQSFEELRGSGWLTAVHPDDRADTARIWSAAVAGRSIYELEHRLRAADGSYRSMMVRAVPILADDGSIAQWIGVHTDITASRQAEAELLRAKEAAEAATRAKSDFLATMSHEIRTPMNGVIGMTEMLLSTPLSSPQQEIARTIQHSGEALLTIINDILDFSKIEAGKLEFEEVEIDLLELVRGTTELMQPQAEAKGVPIFSDLDRTVPRLVRGDGGRLRQVLLNLLSNALKFTARGEVRLQVSVDHDNADRATLRFRISDTGIGFGPEVQERLFRAFSQADSSTTRKFGGTGLGLAICKQLVERMSGEIGCQSTPGRGATFWFTVQLGKPAARRALPLHAEPPPGASLQTPMGVASRELRILVAEDNVVNQRVVQHQLRLLGYAADIVPNGRAALDALRASRYDLVLMDCHMPELDGFETTRRIRAAEGHQPHIIAVTASAMQGDRELCFAAGMDDYVTKPLRAASLLDVLSKVPLAPTASIDPAALAVLDELAEGGSPDIVTELVQSFASSTSQLLREGRATPNDPAHLRMIGHTLRGSCSNFGAARMEALCLKLEQLDHAQAPAQSPDLLDAIEREFRNVLVALEEHCAATGARP